MLYRKYVTISCLSSELYAYKFRQHSQISYSADSQPIIFSFHFMDSRYLYLLDSPTTDISVRSPQKFLARVDGISNPASSLPRFSKHGLPFQFNALQLHQAAEMKAPL